MDVHSPKNGINRYWSIPTSLKSQNKSNKRIPRSLVAHWPTVRPGVVEIELLAHGCAWHPGNPKTWAKTTPCWAWLCSRCNNNKLMQDPWHSGPFSNPRISKVWGFRFGRLNGPLKKNWSHPTSSNVQLQQGWEISKAEGPVRFGKVCCWVVGGFRQIMISNISRTQTSDHFRFSGRFLWLGLESTHSTRRSQEPCNPEGWKVPPWQPMKTVSYTKPRRKNVGSRITNQKNSSGDPFFNRRRLSFVSPKFRLRLRSRTQAAGVGYASA
jgi:hypothetical protein